MHYLWFHISLSHFCSLSGVVSHKGHTATPERVCILRLTRFCTWMCVHIWGDLSYLYLQLGCAAEWLGRCTAGGGTGALRPLQTNGSRQAQLSTPQSNRLTRAHTTKFTVEICNIDAVSSSSKYSQLQAEWHNSNPLNLDVPRRKSPANPFVSSYLWRTSLSSRSRHQAVKTKAASCNTSHIEHLEGMSFHTCTGAS